EQRMHEAGISATEIAHIRVAETAARNYRAQPIAARIHLFLTEDTQFNIARTECAGWESVAPRALIRLCPTPGTHASMMSPPHVAILARALGNELETERTPSR